MCLGTVLSARDALHIGLVNEIAPHGRACEYAYNLALELLKKPAGILSDVKEAVKASFNNPHPTR